MGKDYKHEKEMREHMAKVTIAITKINQEERLDDTDIREILRSLMNAQMMVSDTSDKLGEKLADTIIQLEAKIKKLEDYLFRDYSKDKE